MKCLYLFCIDCSDPMRQIWVLMYGAVKGATVDPVIFVDTSVLHWWKRPLFAPIRAGF